MPIRSLGFLRRLRPRFSLRTLFVTVSLVGIGLMWFGNQVKWLHERQRIKSLALPGVSGSHILETMASPCGQEIIPSAPGILPWFGDNGGVATMILSFYDDPADAPVDHAGEIESIRRLFPESRVIAHLFHERYGAVQSDHRVEIGDWSPLNPAAATDR